MSPAAFAAVFFLAALTQAGVRLARKTYLVDAAPAAERPLYVAFANTAVGGLTLAFGLLGVLAAGAGLTAALIAVAVLGVAGVVAAMVMPEADHMVASAVGAEKRLGAVSGTMGG